MRRKTYTFLIASSKDGGVRKVQVPAYALHVLAVLAMVGGITVLSLAGSYTRMLWKVANYNALRSEQARLQKQFQNLQVMVTDTNQRISSLQSLATEVAMTYGIVRFRQTPFGITDATPLSEEGYLNSLEQFEFLRRHAPAVTLAGSGLRLMPGRGLEDLTFTPSLWPVLGRITGSFGERMDPFSGEGAFHAGVDISSFHGDQVRAAADGMVVAVESRAGYGRLVVIDHGFGISTWYGHLSSYRTRAGTRVKRGEVIGNVGASGRATAPHVHYEVRVHGAPVNPWRYLRGTSAAD